MGGKYLVLFMVLAVSLPLALTTKYKFEKVHEYAMAKVRIILFVLNSMNNQLHVRIRREIGEDKAICNELLVDLPQMNYENHTTHQEALKEKMEDLVVGLTNLANLVVRPETSESDVFTMKDVATLAKNILRVLPSPETRAMIQEKGDTTAKLKVISYILNILDEEYARANIHADDKTDADKIKKKIGDAKYNIKQLLDVIPQLDAVNSVQGILFPSVDIGMDLVSLQSYLLSHSENKHAETTALLFDVAILKDVETLFYDVRHDINVLNGLRSFRW